LHTAARRRLNEEDDSDQFVRRDRGVRHCGDGCADPDLAPNLIATIEHLEHRSTHRDGDRLPQGSAVELGVDGRRRCRIDRDRNRRNHRIDGRGFDRDRNRRHCRRDDCGCSSE
jgi:hypothetical protein